MSTEILTKKNLKNPNLNLKESSIDHSKSQYSNLEHNKVQKNILDKNKKKICINILNKNLRKKVVKKRYEKRIFLGVIISGIVALFYVST